MKGMFLAGVVLYEVWWTLWTIQRSCNDDQWCYGEEIKWPTEWRRNWFDFVNGRLINPEVKFYDSVKQIKAQSSCNKGRERSLVVYRCRWTFAKRTLSCSAFNCHTQRKLDRKHHGKRIWAKFCKTLLGNASALSARWGLSYYRRDGGSSISQ